MCQPFEFLTFLYELKVKITEKLRPFISASEMIMNLSNLLSIFFKPKFNKTNDNNNTLHNSYLEEYSSAPSSSSSSSSSSTSTYSNLTSTTSCVRSSVFASNSEIEVIEDLTFVCKAKSDLYGVEVQELDTQDNVSSKLQEKVEDQGFQELTRMYKVVHKNEEVSPTSVTNHACYVDTLPSDFSFQLQGEIYHDVSDFTVSTFCSRLRSSGFDVVRLKKYKENDQRHKTYHCVIPSLIKQRSNFFGLKRSLVSNGVLQLDQDGISVTFESSTPSKKKIKIKKKHVSFRPKRYKKKFNLMDCVGVKRYKDTPLCSRNSTSSTSQLHTTFDTTSLDNEYDNDSLISSNSRESDSDSHSCLSKRSYRSNNSRTCSMSARRFSLIFPSETLEFTAVSVDQCTILVNGFSALCFRLHLALMIQNSPTEVMVLKTPFVGHGDALRKATTKNRDCGKNQEDKTLISKEYQRIIYLGIRNESL